MKLLVFPHSHYCEKARWVLDYKNIPYETVTIMPGAHMFTVRRYAKNSSVPVLLDGDEAIQGSSDIINYLEDKYPERCLTPTDSQLLKKCVAIEEQMDNRLGVNIRQILYAKLLDYPSYIRFCFTYPMPEYKKTIFSAMYPVLKKKIYNTYVKSDEKVANAQLDFDEALDEVGVILRQQPYLLGDSFTRADLSVASMLSLLVLPKEHPFPWDERIIPDANIRDLHERYLEHPVAKWALEIYRKHR